MSEPMRTYGVKLPDWLGELLEGRAASRRTTVSQVLRWLVDDCFKQPEDTDTLQIRVHELEAELATWRDRFSQLRETFVAIEQQRDSLLAQVHQLNPEQDTTAELLQVVLARIDQLDVDGDALRATIDLARLEHKVLMGNVGAYSLQNERRMQFLEGDAPTEDPTLLALRAHGARFLADAEARHEQEEIDDLISASE